jgi:hypothetical protein
MRDPGRTLFLVGLGPMPRLKVDRPAATAQASRIHSVFSAPDSSTARSEGRPAPHR